MEIFVPGRLCLFGEHSDWAGQYRQLNPDLKPGRAIVTGTNQGIYARVRETPRSLAKRGGLGTAAFEWEASHSKRALAFPHERSL